MLNIEITAASLIKVDQEGNTVEPGRCNIQDLTIGHPRYFPPSQLFLARKKRLFFPCDNVVKIAVLIWCTVYKQRSTNTNTYFNASQKRRDCYLTIPTVLQVIVSRVDLFVFPCEKKMRLSQENSAALMNCIMINSLGSKFQWLSKSNVASHVSYLTGHCPLSCCYFKHCCKARM